MASAQVNAHPSWCEGCLCSRLHLGCAFMLVAYCLMQLEACVQLASLLQLLGPLFELGAATQLVACPIECLTHEFFLPAWSLPCGRAGPFFLTISSGVRLQSADEGGVISPEGGTTTYITVRGDVSPEGGIGLIITGCDISPEGGMIVSRPSRGGNSLESGVALCSLLRPPLAWGPWGGMILAIDVLRGTMVSRLVRGRI